jgi:hypothetical protein
MSAFLAPSSLNYSPLLYPSFFLWKRRIKMERAQQYKSFEVSRIVGEKKFVPKRHTSKATLGRRRIIMLELRDLGVDIKREPKISLYPFTDYFKGFEKIDAIRKLFGERTEEVLGNLKVEFYSSKFGYMGVSDEDGHLLISAHHLRNADPLILYLDIVHELHHVKQFFDGRKLFDFEYEYVDNPIEIEAYKATVEEARRIGMSDAQIVDYLRIEWVTDEQLSRLLKALGVAKA